jgi:hypothetical protein
MEKVTQGNKCDGGGVLLAVMVVGALQKGGWAVVVRMEAGHVCGGHR